MILAGFYFLSFFFEHHHVEQNMSKLIEGYYKATDHFYNIVKVLFIKSDKLYSQINNAQSLIVE